MEKLIVLLIVVAFSVVQSIVKAAKEKADKQRVEKVEPGRKQRVQSEIEAFLSEVSGGNPKPPRQAADTQRTAERRERRRQQAEIKRRQQQQKVQQSKARRPRRPVADSKSRKKGERRVGSGVTEHVNEYISQHVSQHIDRDVDEYVEATIVDNVEGHLGNRLLEMPSGPKPKRGSAAAASIRTMLRNPEGIRNAILINEVLSRPAALRR